MKSFGLLVAAAVASAAPNFDGGAVTGDSTHYGGNLNGGACLFSTYTLPSNLFGTAFSGSAWDSSSVCGSCVEVTGPNGNTIKAMIVDKCPECDEGHLDLFMNAFAELDDPGVGIISTSYTFVPCGISSPLILHNKEGTSPHWFSMQVVNANEPVDSLEVSTDGGSTWQQTVRSDYNFFENTSGFGTDEVDVRVKSNTGKTVTVKGVSIQANLETTAGSNFGGGSSNEVDDAPAPVVEAPSPSSEPEAPATTAPQPKTSADVDDSAPAPEVTSPPAEATTPLAPAPVSSSRPKCKRSKNRKNKRTHKRSL